MLQTTLSAGLSVMDDVVGRGLCAMIEADPRFDLVARCASVPELHTALTSCEPAVAVVDVRTMHGVGDMYRLSSRHPGTSFAVFAEDLSDAEASQLWRFGARCQIPWSANANHVSSQLFGIAGYGSFADMRPSPASTSMSRVLLSSRELEILDHLKTGRTNPEIANSLVISIETVKTHVSSVLRKLGVGSRYQLVRQGENFTLQKSLAGG